EEERQPRPQELPAHRQAPDDESEHNEAADETDSAERFHNRRRGNSGLVEFLVERISHRRPVVEVPGPDQREPDGNPQQADGADRPEGDGPAAAKVFDELRVERDQDRGERRTALEDAVAERPVLRGKNLPRRDECTGPVPRFEDPEYRPAEEQ